MFRWVVAALAVVALSGVAGEAGATACQPLALSFFDPSTRAAVSYTAADGTLQFITPDGRRLVLTGARRFGRGNGGPVTVVAHSPTLTIILSARPRDGRGQATAVERTAGAASAKAARKTYVLGVYAGPSQAPACAGETPVRGSPTPGHATATPTPRQMRTPAATATPRATATPHPTSTPRATTNATASPGAQPFS